MTPEYLEELADIADPMQLWRLPALTHGALPKHIRAQLDTGVALRRCADDQRELARALEAKKSVLITPIAPHHTAHRMIDTPEDHEQLRRQRL